MKHKTVLWLHNEILSQYNNHLKYIWTGDYNCSTNINKTTQTRNGKPSTHVLLSDMQNDSHCWQATGTDSQPRCTFYYFKDITTEKLTMLQGRYEKMYIICKLI
jgi:hypothetical protein